MISEIIADLKARGSTAVMDDDFARDIEEAIKVQRQPWNRCTDECSPPTPNEELTAPGTHPAFLIQPHPLGELRGS